MALFTDTFTGVPTNLLTAHGWSVNGPDTGGLALNGGGTGLALNNGTTTTWTAWLPPTQPSGADHYAQGVLPIAAGNWFPLATRLNAANKTGYLARRSSTSAVQLQRGNNGSLTSLGTYTGADVTSAAVIKLESVGNQHTVYVNGVARIGPVTDATYPADTSVGIITRNGSPGTATALDNWESSELASGTYTMVASAGELTLTGSAAGLKVARKLSVDAGSFSLTGTVAGCAVARRLSADGGSFNLTCSDTGLVAARRLSVAGGGLVLSGGDAGVRAGRRLSADTGEFALTGSTAALVWSASPASGLVTAQVYILPRIRRHFILPQIRRDFTLPALRRHFIPRKHQMSTVLDSKPAAASLRYSFDFVNSLNSGDEIVDAAGSEVVLGDVVLTDLNISGTKVTYRLSGGTPGTRCEFLIFGNTAGGDNLYHRGMILVQG